MIGWITLDTLYQSIVLVPIHYYHYHIGYGRAKVKSGISYQLTPTDAITNELEPLCKFLKSNAQAHLNNFYKSDTSIQKYAVGTDIAHGNTCKGAATIFDDTYKPKALKTWALYARMIAFSIYYNNYIRHKTEQFCKLHNFDQHQVTYAQANLHILDTVGVSLNKKIFRRVMKSKAISTIPTIGKLIVPFSDMDNYTCLPQYFKYNNGMLHCHFRSYTGGIVIDFRLPRYFREQVEQIINDPNKKLMKDMILTKPTLIYDDTQEDPTKRFTWSCTISYTVTPVKENNDQVLSFDLGEKNHAVMATATKKGAYSNVITTGREHKRLLLKIGYNLQKIRNIQKQINKMQRNIKSIKKRNPTSPSIKKIQINEIAPRFIEIQRCCAKNSRIKKHLSWVLARDIKRACLRLGLSKIVTEDLRFSCKDNWTKGQDIACITWVCAKAGLELTIKTMYYASHTCPFCGSYLQANYGACRISNCNGIPVSNHWIKHPPQKPKDSKCRWKGDRDYTACLYMLANYFGIKMDHSKQFTVGSTPLHISQRVDKMA